MTVESMFDLVNARGHFPRQHVQENFSGADLDLDRWRVVNTTGTNIFRIADVIDGGFEIVTGATNGDQGSFDFNNKNQYHHQGCIMIWTMGLVESATRRQQWGLFDNFATSADFATVTNDTNATFYELTTKDAATSSTTATTISINEVFTEHKLDASSGDYKYSQNGILVITKETNLPTKALQPAGSMLTRATGTKTGRWRSCEVFNK